MMKRQKKFGAFEKVLPYLRKMRLGKSLLTSSIQAMSAAPISSMLAGYMPVVFIQVAAVQ